MLEKIVNARKKYFLAEENIYFKVEKFSLGGMKTLCVQTERANDFGCDDGDVVVGKM